MQKPSQPLSASKPAEESSTPKRKKRSWLYLLFNAEIPDLPDSLKFIERISLIGFIVVFTFVMVQTYPGIFLGFGLGDAWEWSLILSFFTDLHDDSPILFWLSLLALGANLANRLQLFLRGQLAYSSNDSALPIKTIVLFMVANSLNVVFVFATVVMIGTIGWWLGFDFQAGFNAVENLIHAAITLADSIPTVIELPLLAAFILTYVAQGFFHYWVHRLCHLNRFMWLTLHRFHHMPDILTPATTNVVITSIPFFIGVVFAKTFLFAAIAKLFYEEHLFMEMFFFHLIITFADPYGHQTALFKEGIRSRWTRVLCFISGNGLYHYLHHSNDEEIVTSNTTNQVNIGGGIAYCWDIVFGTFKELPKPDAPKPDVGLWGKPKLHHNPIRLLLSGILQIMYEVYYNKGWLTKAKCIFGSVNYTPPITRHFHISEESQ
ncbi:sterol desaturase family protein [Veronia pacifica]|uniref:Fatty acid hydroxylase domain-containing protein n=1 Tax=Veronia pacifica TaxID=1080227 RepID=A0A1C3EQ22_9GAMM|nr:sterol desaturase family protein [Veronia pacifica]ODA35350.1 hypothetical protein A8L45_04080 [Veronia pacifica]